MGEGTAKRAPVVLLGVDVGTSSVKAVAFDPSGALLEQARVATPTVSPKDGWVEHNPEQLWAAVAEVIRAVVSALGAQRPVLSVAVTSVGESGLFVDRDGEALCPVIAWNDRRTVQEGQWWLDHVGIDVVHRIAGQSVDPHYGASKIMWVKAHDKQTYAKARAWLSVADWINLRLTGTFATDPTLASRTMLLDQQAGRWSQTLIEASDIRPSVLPEILNCGSLIGAVNSRAAEQTSLHEGTAVVVAGHDRLCGAFAARAGGHDAVDSVGSAEAVVMPLYSYPRLGAEDAGYVAVYRDVVPEQFVVSARVGYAGTLLDWARQLLAARGCELPTYADLMADIPQPLAPSGLLVFPSFGRMVTPYWSADQLPGMITGLDVTHTRGHLVQGLLEGICYSLRASVELAERLGGRSETRLLVEGGATRNKIWTQIKADVMQRAIDTVTLPDATALGAALQAGIGLGLFADHSEAASVASRQATTFRYLPDAGRAAEYDRIYRDGYLRIADQQGVVNRTLRGTAHDH